MSKLYHVQVDIFFDDGVYLIDSINSFKHSKPVEFIDLVKTIRKYQHNFLAYLGADLDINSQENYFLVCELTEKQLKYIHKKFEINFNMKFCSEETEKDVLKLLGYLDVFPCPL